MTAPSQPRLPACEFCGGQQVGGLQLTGQYVGVHPRGKRMWMRPLSTVSAVTCLGCGHTRLVADDLPALRKEAQENPHHFYW
ncbi:hypothetical protein [Saccharopolyspora mangrovi]|uniref:YgiT-type zinc finger protein n=1 Tax=Saccharopolyspora mangrovi TaxID=3082379 RepID=A0ABU6A7W8_9PSEU|nr:hypothetical protein [Saccharopolyspora sp. S2-29]MEB3367548.1 hypothetical protein [Saccharopolyspora sp. S2-29]